MNWIFLFSALGLLLWFIALLYLRSYIIRLSRSASPIRALREEVQLLKADIDEKTDQNLSLLEDKIAALRELIAEAEKRVALYARELDRKKGEEAALATLKGASTPQRRTGAAQTKKAAGKKRPALIETLEVRDLKLADASRAYKTQRDSLPPSQQAPLAAPQAAHTGPQMPEAKDRAPENQATRPAESPAPQAENGPRFVRAKTPVIPAGPSLRERVLELYSAGFSGDIIAARLGISVAEARLYLSLAQKT